jgi:hypothetical protein
MASLVTGAAVLTISQLAMAQASRTRACSVLACPIQRGGVFARQNHNTPAADEGRA